MNGPHVHRVALIIASVAESIEGCLAESFRSLAILWGHPMKHPCYACNVVVGLWHSVTLGVMNLVTQDGIYIIGSFWSGYVAEIQHRGVGAGSRSGM